MKDDPGNAGLQPSASVGPEPDSPSRLQPREPVGQEPDIPRPSSLADSPHRGWYSCGYLPHFDAPHIIQHVTYRLADSLPTDVLDALNCELRALPPERRDALRRQRIEAWIDAGHGCCLLRQPDAARLVQNAFLHFDGLRYRLLAWVVMPNHVHVLFEPYEGWPLAAIVGSWKSYTGRRLAAHMPTAVQSNGTRRVWQREYWDRYIRDERHYLAAEAYVRNNPVKAGLVARAEEWPWSSAALSEDR